MRKESIKFLNFEGNPKFEFCADDIFQDGRKESEIIIRHQHTIDYCILENKIVIFEKSGLKIISKIYISIANEQIFLKILSFRLRTHTNEIFV